MLPDGSNYDDVLRVIARIAANEKNLGNTGNWLFSCLRALEGVQQRMTSLEENRRLVYEWHPQVSIAGHERHIAIMLFCMDSAFECLVFALNALGQAHTPQGFRSLSDEKALKNITPKDVIGLANSQIGSGWLSLFPRFQQHCQNHATLNTLIAENHDVTKHRHSGFDGGTIRQDPPPCFYENLGLPKNHPRRNSIVPMQEVLIPLHPKLPEDVKPKALSECTYLEKVIDEFCEFINQGLLLVIKDILVCFGLNLNPEGVSN
ncbi:hypothetical protein KKC22_20800 [Myxococcota bacterium]|nr:hypothetical protein [Myxococcota bacterium]